MFKVTSSSRGSEVRGRGQWPLRGTGGPDATTASGAVLSQPCQASLLVVDEIASVPVSLQTVKPATDRANPRVGVGTLAFSSDNYFLATRNGQCSSPTSLSTPFPPVPATQTAPARSVPHLSAEPALLPTEASRARGFVSRSAQFPSSPLTPSCLGRTRIQALLQP